MITTREQEVRIFQSELMDALRDQYEFLWYFSKRMARCKCCGGRAGWQPFRIFINGYGDFIVYNNCEHCEYPVSFYVELSQEPSVNDRVLELWLVKHN